jgi:hypothetical protein
MHRHAAAREHARENVGNAERLAQRVSRLLVGESMPPTLAGNGFVDAKASGTALVAAPVREGVRGSGNSGNSG